MLDATRQTPDDPWLAAWVVEIPRVLAGLANVLQGGRLTEPVVHKSRREIKRLRSLLRLAPRSVEILADDTREVTRELRRRLGQSRDAAVMLKTLGSLGDELGAAASRIAPVLSAHHRNISATLDRSSRRRDRDRIARLGTAWRRLAVHGEVADLRKQAVRTYRRARRLAAALKGGKDPALHALRKASVDHQNHLAFFAVDAKGKLHARHAKVKRLRDELGLCNDLEVLRAFVRTRVDISAGDLIELEGVLAKRHRQLMEKAIKLAAALFAGKPRQFDKWLSREIEKARNADTALSRPDRHPPIVPASDAGDWTLSQAPGHGR
jgi:CHAD domain-containing protein